MQVLDLSTSANPIPRIFFAAFILRSCVALQIVAVALSERDFL
jgi:hypothetical protein